MAKCGKGCMPECEYFTTGGCISPFNCMYKIETGYINSATSTPDSLTDLRNSKERIEKGKITNEDRLTAHNEAGQGIINMNGVSDELGVRERIRRFLLIISKLTEYEDTGLSPDEVNELKAENAALRERLNKAVELPVKVGDTVYLLSQTSRCPTGEIVEAKIIDFIGWEDGYKFNAKGEEAWFLFLRGDIGTWVFTTREAAEARLAELKGGKE